jgi:hypothetical protein
MTQAEGQAGQRQHLHFDALIAQVRQRFETILDHRREPIFSLADTLMAGLAVFSLKDPSLLAFCRRCVDHNLGSVFGLQAIPSDTQMREILDEVDPKDLRAPFQDLFRQVQRGKVLEDYLFLDEGYLIALDGVEYFCSKKVHCPHCMTRHHRNGEVSYYHQLLGAAIVHPDFPEVIPLAPEPIQRQDGHKKNDCERNSARRWLKRFRKEHPYLQVIIIEDALSSNAPHIRDLKDADCHFILGVKPGDHRHLFEQVKQRQEAGLAGVHEVKDAKTGTIHRYVFIHKVSINEANQEVEVNFLKYQEIKDDQVIREWSWVTDLSLTVNNVERIMLAARCRWRIENETFNTLKNQGYHFEHNYGHGNNQLCVVLALLMMLAFGIDQVQQKTNPLFRQAWEKKGAKCALWEAMRNLFACFEVASMRQIYEAIAFGHERPPLKPLTRQTQAASKVAANTS